MNLIPGLGTPAKKKKKKKKERVCLREFLLRCSRVKDLALSQQWLRFSPWPRELLYAIGAAKGKKSMPEYEPVFRKPFHGVWVGIITSCIYYPDPNALLIAQKWEDRNSGNVLTLLPEEPGNHRVHVSKNQNRVPRR